MPNLTIAIPTYNRNEFLARLLAELIPQLTKSCQVLVIDNHSDVPVEETLAPVLAREQSSQIRIIRNRINIGGNANVMRCFELCETPWLWVLGDDDTLLPNAIETIFETIASYPQAVYVNFASEIYPRPETFVTTGLIEFAERMDSFGNALFLSASLYQMRALPNGLSWAYYYMYSCGPQLALVILNLGEAQQCLFSSSRIVKWEQPPPEQAYSAVIVSVGRTTLLELPIPQRARVALARAIKESAYTLRALSRELYYIGCARGDLDTSRYIYDQLVSRLYYFDKSPLTRLKLRFYRQAFKYPRLFRILNSCSAKLTGRQIQEFRAAARNE